MRFIQVLLLAHRLLFIRADHQTERLTFQVQSAELPSLSFQDWTSVINVQPAGLASVPSASHDSFEPAIDSAPEPSKEKLPDDDLFQSSQKPVIAKLQAFVESIVNLALAPLSHLPHLPWPHHHHPKPIDLSQYTIWEVLNWTLHHPHKSDNNDHHSVPIQRLAWLVNQSEPIQKILSNPEADLTLFAPDNEALTPPHKRHHHGHGHGHGPGPHSPRDEPLTPPEDHVFWQALESNSLKSGHHSFSEGYHLQDDGEDKDKKKKIFLHLLEMVLQYHVSPGKKSLKDILDSSTLPSALKISHHSCSPAFRVRVGGPPHFTKGTTALNFFTALGAHDDRPILTKNGVIHVVHGVPLLPPLSPLSQLFLYPQPFSTLTSALQKVKLDDILLPSWDNKTIPLESESLDADLDVVDERVQNVLSSLAAENEHRLKKKSFTVFAPTNRAFRSLGPHANAFLFSPFGAPILRYVLSYHIVPDVIFYTDHVDKTKNATVTMTGSDSDLDFLFRTKDDDDLSLFGRHDLPRSTPGHPHVSLHPKCPGHKANVTHISLPTLLGSAKNETLSISLVKFHLPGSSKELKRKVYVKQPIPPPGKDHPGKPLRPIPVVIADGVAWGGAIHVIHNLIHPPVHPGHPAHPHLQRIFSASEGQGKF
ncbi:hypothetical protein DFH28DRAFT_1087011 [Melampsora americana]|nr:hypothetical protein DFH28DRAFT_1087011 [Melampsora americana]